MFNKICVLKNNFFIGMIILFGIFYLFFRYPLILADTFEYSINMFTPFSIRQLSEDVKKMNTVIETEVKRMEDIDYSIVNYGKVTYSGKMAEVIEIEDVESDLDEGWIFKKHKKIYTTYITLKIDSGAILKVRKCDPKIEGLGGVKGR